MNKIIDLLKQMGASKELCEQFIRDLESWKKSQKSEINEEFGKRLVAAKKACIEETENYKSELAKRVSIFLEARANTVSREAQKQAAIGESKAVRTLKGVRGLVEGVEIDVPDVQVAGEIKKLRIKVGQLQEHNQKLTMKNKNVNTICKELIGRVQLAESVTATAKVVTESKNSGVGGGLEKLRTKGATPMTTRKPINESVAKTGKRAEIAGDPAVMAIAESLDGSPAGLIQD